MGPRVLRRRLGAAAAREVRRLRDQVSMPWFWARVHLPHAAARLPARRLPAALRAAGRADPRRAAASRARRGGAARSSRAGRRACASRPTGRPSTSTGPGRRCPRGCSCASPTGCPTRTARARTGADCARRPLPDPGARPPADRRLLAEHQRSRLPVPRRWSSTRNFMPAADYGGRHLLYLGNYLPMDRRAVRAESDERDAGRRSCPTCGSSTRLRPDRGSRSTGCSRPRSPSRS